MEETPNVTPATSMTSSLMGSLSNISEADKAAFESEKMKIYQQLDDKVQACMQTSEKEGAKFRNLSKGGVNLNSEFEARIRGINTVSGDKLHDSEIICLAMGV